MRSRIGHGVRDRVGGIQVVAGDRHRVAALGKLELEKEFKGDAYQARKAREIPGTLAAASQALKKSTMLRDAMGSDVIDHYVRTAEWELEDFASKVTDYEVNRGFERA